MHNASTTKNQRHALSLTCMWYKINTSELLVKYSVWVLGGTTVLPSYSLHL